MKKFLIPILLIFNLRAIDFTLIDSFDAGVEFPYANIKGADIDGDGLIELIFCARFQGNARILIYERLQGGGFNLVHVVPVYPSDWWAFETFELGDFDNDNKTDIFETTFNPVTARDYFEIIESKEIFSFPDTLVWKDSFNLTNINTPTVYLSDYDKDNYLNIILSKSTAARLFSYENFDDNSYNLVFYKTIYNPGWKAVGDIDLDSLPDFIIVKDSAGFGVVTMFESNRDNYLIPVGDIFLDNVESAAYYDNLFVKDINNNGKPEVMVHAHCPQPYSGTWRDDIWLIEATGDNQYQVIWYDSIPNNPCYPDYGSRSSAGDVTGDGIPEIILSMTTRVYVIQYIPGQGYTYIWQKYFPSNTGNISTTVYDINGNGINDIVISVQYHPENCVTYIYEKSPSISEKYKKISPYFNVFPSITSDSIKVFYSLNSKNFANFYIYNVLGEKVYYKKMKPAGSLYISFKKLKLKPGIYFLKIKSGNFKKMQKIIFLR